jgi:hypothetical protein
LQRAEERALAAEKVIADAQKHWNITVGKTLDYSPMSKILQSIDLTAAREMMRKAAENARKAAAFDHIASLKTEWSGHCCNGKGEYTFIPDVEAFEPYDPTECASAPTLLEAVEMTMGKEADRG